MRCDCCLSTIRKEGDYVNIRFMSSIATDITDGGGGKYTIPDRNKHLKAKFGYNYFKLSNVYRKAYCAGCVKSTYPISFLIDNLIILSYDYNGGKNE